MTFEDGEPPIRSDVNLPVHSRAILTIPVKRNR